MCSGSLRVLAAWLCVATAVASASLKPAPPRRVVTLDGTWRIAEGAMDTMPTAFEHTVPVPGLADMADPPFEKVGFDVPLREAFWYRRTFTFDGPMPDVAVLLIRKAKYGTKIWLNGQLVGEHLPCFTPAYMDVKEHLRGDGRENELTIRVGAYRTAVPEGQPSGWDFEKYRYIPGIYDSVELILTSGPYIANVQTVPQIGQASVRAVVELQGLAADTTTAVECEAREAVSGRLVGTARLADLRLKEDTIVKADVTVPIENMRLWSSEDPFLYELTVKTSGDAARVRFGMRSFRFDPDSGRAVLNGKPYYMRGTNVCIYRFFEDSLRADRPWRAEWVRRLHETFKTMHWNAIRYCIGFPPDFWYDIADEAGFLIQDEFPIWLLSRAPENPVAEKIIPEYTAWMRHRWNHACVVIWDAQNESLTDQTGKALQAVRSLDLSDRPWENGWAEPQAATDGVESHPYLFIRSWSGQKPFRMSEMPGVGPVPHLNDRQKKLPVPIIINEYAWLWLNRDGTPTTLTKKIYRELLGDWSTSQQRRHLYARYLAALTEFWRTRRTCAGVLHFCGLGYSRSGLLERPEGGATSDHFVDLERLILEPDFERYVRDAFSPVGVMLDYWAETERPGQRRSLKVHVINDRHEDWSGRLILRIIGPATDAVLDRRSCTVKALGHEVISLDATLPPQVGRYTLIAGLQDESGLNVQSCRDVRITCEED